MDPGGILICPSQWANRHVGIIVQGVFPLLVIEKSELIFKPICYIRQELSLHCFHGSSKFLELELASLLRKVGMRLEQGSEWQSFTMIMYEDRFTNLGKNFYYS